MNLFEHRMTSDLHNKICQGHSNLEVDSCFHPLLCSRAVLTTASSWSGLRLHDLKHTLLWPRRTGRQVGEVMRIKKKIASSGSLLSTSNACKTGWRKLSERCLLVLKGEWASGFLKLSLYNSHTYPDYSNHVRSQTTPLSTSKKAAS